MRLKKSGVPQFEDEFEEDLGDVVSRYEEMRPQFIQVLERKSPATTIAHLPFLFRESILGSTTARLGSNNIKLSKAISPRSVLE